MAKFIDIDPSRLLEKEMDRRDFLKHIGVAIIALTGVSALIRALVQQPTVRRGTQNVQTSYGAYAYGGVTHKENSP